VDFISDDTHNSNGDAVPYFNESGDYVVYVRYEYKGLRREITAWDCFNATTVKARSIEAALDAFPQSKAGQCGVTWGEAKRGAEFRNTTAPIPSDDDNLYFSHGKCFESTHMHGAKSGQPRYSPQSWFKRIGPVPRDNWHTQFSAHNSKYKDKALADWKGPFVYKTTGARTADNVVSCDFVMVDIDEQMTFDGAVEHINALGLEALFLTSWSHGIAKGDKEPCDRFRIVFPLRKRLVFNEIIREGLNGHQIWQDLYRAICEDLKLPFDRACADAARIMYVHASSKENAHLARSEYVQGVFLDYRNFVQASRNTLPVPSNKNAVAVNRTTRRAQIRTTTRVSPYDLRGVKLATMIVEHAPQVVAGMFRNGKVSVVCPLAFQHSDPNDDGGCWIKDAETKDEHAIVRCSHTSCKGSLTENFLDAWLAGGVILAGLLPAPPANKTRRKHTSTQDIWLTKRRGINDIEPVD
jgi:hypothetical protein